MMRGGRIHGGHGSVAWLMLIVVAAAAAVLGVGLAINLQVALIAMVALSALASICYRPISLIYITVFLGPTALPDFLPRQFDLSGITVYLYELCLVMLAAWALRIPKNNTAVLRLMWPLALLLLSGSVIAIASGTSVVRLLADSHGLLLLLLGAVGSALFAHAQFRDHLLRAVRLSLWSSAAVLVAASSGAIRVGGRTEAAVLALTDGSFTEASANRFLTPATHFSLLVLCVVFARAFYRGANSKLWFTYAAPAAFITILSFSRNALLALAASVIFALLTVRPTQGGLSVGVRRFATVAAIVSFPILLSRVFPSLPLSIWVNSQISSYSSRVLGGISDAAAGTDTSATARVFENGYLFKAISSSPIFGHGFGFAYRPARGSAGSFDATTGQFYAHNFYLWLLVKIGCVGLILFFFFVWKCVFQGVSRASEMELALRSGAVALLVVSVVAPLPLGVESASGALLGAVLGGCFYASGIAEHGRTVELPEASKSSR